MKRRPQGEVSGSRFLVDSHLPEGEEPGSHGRGRSWDWPPLCTLALVGLALVGLALVGARGIGARGTGRIDLILF